ncbi:glucokinase [Lysobacter niastensis]|uniref:Glucokinase n=1 Tax=Lysobacter niastensis TaxID=380629 RepID=A0ABS0B3J6_9GAMM|nr:glucokinase [Lysobacter niastensis]MBF6022424.1 glucokinase [Lysobacter niastensis]
MPDSIRSRAGLSLGQPFIAADVGGTFARLGLVQMGEDGKVAVLEYRRYACASHPSLASILRDFAEAVPAQADSVQAEHAVVAIAGRLEGDTLINSNLPWPVSLERTRWEAGIGHIGLLNDFEAVACAMPYIEPSAMSRVCGPEDGAAERAGPALVLGPGTGFGASLYLPRNLQPGSRPSVLASEAGHASLAAGNDRELQLVRHLLKRWSHVDNERVLSGPGLLNMYRALCEIDGRAPELDSPVMITAAAYERSDAHAVEAVGMFCGLLGSLAGDLAVTFGAASVYLAGGIPAQISALLMESDFAARFRNKGVLGEVLARVPVWLVDHGQLGLVGAAAWYFERNGDR